MFKSLSGKEKVLEVSPIGIPVKAIKGSNIDPRLIVKTGKRGKTVFMKSPCVGECAGCDEQFEPVPPDEGKTYCLKYSSPKAMWTGLNANGQPKTCLVRVQPKSEKDPSFKLNPIKASKRGAPQSSVAAATGSKESKDKKKTERRDPR